MPLPVQFFESLLEAAPDAMIVVDSDGQIVLVNGQAEVMFGYEREQLLNQKIELLLPTELHERHVKHRQKFAGDANLRPMGLGLELHGRRRNGESFPVEISLSPIRTEPGQYVCSVIRDVTKRKTMESELIEARKEAERANRANRAFLAAASHDLRQPVQALMLLNGVLKRTVDSPKAQQMLESQNQSLSAMTNLLNSLLDISRLDAGALAPKLEHFPISRLIEQLTPEFTRQASQKGLIFSAKAIEGVVHTDMSMLSEIIHNFVSNSIRYTKSGEVSLSCHDHGDQCEIRVCDTGIGIAEDQLDAIFNEFHQCKTEDGSSEGFGLGLAIVRRLADLLTLSIDVDSTVGEGSCFSIRVPLVDSQNLALEAANEDYQGKASGDVLLIEDDKNVAEALLLLLEAEGYRVICADTAAAALQQVEKHSYTPSLIISDYHLADEETGVDAIVAIRSACDSMIPALIVTGDTSHVVNNAQSLSHCALLNKPIDPDHLLEMAQLALGHV